MSEYFSTNTYKIQTYYLNFVTIHNRKLKFKSIFIVSEKFNIHWDVINIDLFTEAGFCIDQNESKCEECNSSID